MALQKATDGFIMMCSNETEHDCLSLNMFGCNSLRQLQHVSEDTFLFLYNYSSKLLHGVWRRKEEPTWNPNSQIFGGQFPAHLPVERLAICCPVPLAGRAAELLSCSTTMIFDPFLTAKQVCDCQLQQLQ